MAINKEKRWTMIHKTLPRKLGKIEHYDFHPLYCLSFVSFFLIYGHYIVCPSPRFSLFMAIILTVLRLVFPYLWPLYFLSFAYIMAINKEKRGEGQTI
jgi:hypothetical protein